MTVTSHIFHCVVDDGLVYLCMTDEEFPRRIPFTFLDDIKNRFRAAYGDRGKRALAYEMNEDFKKVLQKQAVCIEPSHLVDLCRTSTRTIPVRIVLVVFEAKLKR